MEHQGEDVKASALEGYSLVVIGVVRVEVSERRKDENGVRHMVHAFLELVAEA